MEVKDLIRTQREYLHLTLEQIGNYVGVEKGTVKKWESGCISNLRRDKIAKLAEILQISPLELIYDDTEKINSLHNTYEKKRTSIVNNINPQINSLMQKAQLLNPQGISKLNEYADDLVASGNYNKTKSKETAI